MFSARSSTTAALRSTETQREQLSKIQPANGAAGAGGPSELFTAREAKRVEARTRDRLPGVTIIDRIITAGRPNRHQRSGAGNICDYRSKSGESLDQSPRLAAIAGDCEIVRRIVLFLIITADDYTVACIAKADREDARRLTGLQRCLKDFPRAASIRRAQHARAPRGAQTDPGMIAAIDGDVGSTRGERPFVVLGRGQFVWRYARPMLTAIRCHQDVELPIN